MFLTKCLLGALIPLNLSWKISNCAPANFFFEHSKFDKRSLCYILIVLFSSLFMYNFISSLKWSLWYSLKLMKLPGRDRCRIPSEHTTYVRLIGIQFRLCVHVSVRTNIFHKCSESYRVRAPRFKDHVVVQKSCSSSSSSSSNSSSSSAFHSSKVISKLYFNDLYER